MTDLRPLVQARLALKDARRLLEEHEALAAPAAVLRLDLDRVSSAEAALRAAEAAAA